MSDRQLMRKEEDNNIGFLHSSFTSFSWSTRPSASVCSFFLCSFFLFKHCTFCERWRGPFFSTILSYPFFSFAVCSLLSSGVGSPMATQCKWIRQNSQTQTDRQTSSQTLFRFPLRPLFFVAVEMTIYNVPVCVCAKCTDEICIFLLTLSKWGGEYS